MHYWLTFYFATVVTVLLCPFWQFQFKSVSVSLLREQDGQASGGNDSGNDDWIFTIREKDPKKIQNGIMQQSELDHSEVKGREKLSALYMCTGVH